MTWRPHVSVVVPTYRRPEFLGRAIASVAEQTVSSWELIIVDDNPPESSARSETRAIASSYASDKRIRYICHDENRGGAAARNTGIRLATAPYVAFLDDDDEWHPTKLERQLECLENSPNQTALVYCRTRLVDVVTGSETVQRIDGRSHAVKDLLVQNTIGSTSCVLCRVEAVQDVGMFDETLPARQDQDLYLQLALRYEFAFVDAVLVTVYIHDHPRISTDFAGSVAAHDLFYEKYRPRIEADPHVVRIMRHQQGKHLVAAQRYREARTLLTQAWLAKPSDLAVLTRLAMTFSLARWFVGPIKRFRRFVRSALR